MIVVPAAAKVNLALEVTGRRADGYHDVATVIVALDWHDLVGLRLRPGSGEVWLRLGGPAAEGVPEGPENLAVRAALALVELAGGGLDADLWLEKRLPIAAGMGGGSADAAAVLRAGATLLRRRGLPLPAGEVGAAAAALGSDVPAALAGGAVLATGRGERLRRLPSPALHLAVAVAGASATAAAYAALDEAERRGDGRAARVAERLAAGLPPAGGDCGSALEPAARRASPRLGERLAELRARVAGDWHLTGTGGAAFALAGSAAAAGALAAAATVAGFPARPCRTVAAHPGIDAR
ncbi:MAG TPA: 4-(cytidine 5'-diphospho)-2-C-methyl-D-erythritol kinase [Candidatus Dormibacteraeota bacterium]